MMNKKLIFSVMLGVSGLAWAQMPTSFDASGRSAQNQAGVTDNNPAREGEVASPRLFGIELPLMDPANDTVSYNGAMFDVGNNKLVRERFEKYLNSTPDNSSDAKKYRAGINEILDCSNKYTRARTVGSPLLGKIGRGLLEVGGFPGDGGQSTALASAMLSALEALRANQDRDKANVEMNKEIDRFMRDANRLTNNNAASPLRKLKNGTQMGGKTLNAVAIAHKTQEAAGRKAAITKNEALNDTNLMMAKTNYQALLMSFIAQRRYDHAVIGCRVYRHLFRDGDTQLKMDKESDAYKMVSGIGGMPPTVNMMDTLASNARQEVDKSIDAVHNLLAQNKLSEATERLITAVAIGEYMQSASTFPTASRRRIAHFWTLRKRGLTAINSRDYDTAETVAAEMKSLDADYDDSLLRSYCTGKKQLSDLHVRNAMKAITAGDNETFNKEIMAAGAIWPLNPNLAKGQEQLATLDNFEPVKEEFRTLIARKEYRTIAKEQEKYEVVATDPELKPQYRKAIEFVGTVDAMIKQLDIVAEQDRTMGPCMAYEKLIAFRDENEDCSQDVEFIKSLNRYESAAHEFVQAIRDAEDCENREEYGSALSNLYRARCICPGSNMVKTGISRVTDVIVNAQYD